MVCKQGVSMQCTWCILADLGADDHFTAGQCLDCLAKQLHFATVQNSRHNSHVQASQMGFYDRLQALTTLDKQDRVQDCFIDGECR